MNYEKRVWSLDEYVQVFQQHYKAAANQFEPIEIAFGGRTWELKFEQTPRILYYGEGWERPAFINRHHVTNEQWYYYCADSGLDLPPAVDYAERFQDEVLRMPVVNISAIQVAEYYNWLNQKYGFPKAYETTETTIEPLHAGIGFLIPSKREMEAIIFGLEEMTEEEISVYAWHRGNAHGEMQPVATEKLPYFNKFQVGTLYHDGTFEPTSIGAAGPVGNAYWICFDVDEEFPPLSPEEIAEQLNA